MQVFDRAHFEIMTGGDAALQREVIALFRGQVEDWSTVWASESWREAVHTIKGSARGLGLHALAAACEAAEQRPRAREEVAAALADAVAALDQFVAAGRGALSR